MTFPWQFQKNQCEGCNHYSFDPEIEKTKNFKGQLKKKIKETFCACTSRFYHEQILISKRKNPQYYLIH